MQECPLERCWALCRGHSEGCRGELRKEDVSSPGQSGEYGRTVQTDGHQQGRKHRQYWRKRPEPGPGVPPGAKAQTQARLHRAGSVFAGKGSTAELSDPPVGLEFLGVPTGLLLRSSGGGVYTGRSAKLAPAPLCPRSSDTHFPEKVLDPTGHRTPPSSQSQAPAVGWTSTCHCPLGDGCILAGTL